MAAAGLRRVHAQRRIIVVALTAGSDGGRRAGVGGHGLHVARGRDDGVRDTAAAALAKAVVAPGVVIVDGPVVGRGAVLTSANEGRILRVQLWRKFGVPSADVLRQLAKADGDELDRVALRILSAGSPEECFVTER